MGRVPKQQKKFTAEEIVIIMALVGVFAFLCWFFSWLFS